MSEVSKTYCSCSYIENGLVFYPNDLTFCCYQKPPMHSCAQGSAGDVIDVFLDNKSKIIEANQGENPPCGWCPIFREYEKTNEKINYINFSTHCYCQFFVLIVHCKKQMLS